MQIDMQDVNQVLASHFNDFGQKVIEAYIRPLKIKDSVLKYRVPIQSVLRNWAEDDALLLAMANAALQDKRGDTMEKCRADLLRKFSGSTSDTITWSTTISMRSTRRFAAIQERRRKKWKI